MKADTNTNTKMKTNTNTKMNTNTNRNTKMNMKTTLTKSKKKQCADYQFWDRNVKPHCIYMGHFPQDGEKLHCDQTV